MIRFEKTSVMNMENALRGARNPMSSWSRSDSYYDEEGKYILGENDLQLAKKLRKAGSDHRKFLRQIFVSADITVFIYWWKEYDTYKIATVANSTSTMHKIHTKEFEIEDFSSDRLSKEGLLTLELIIKALENTRLRYNKSRSKADWYDIIQLLPSSYNQMRTCTLNYESLINIYFARKNHKLDEWNSFCDWISTLPYADELIINTDRAVD